VILAAAEQTLVKDGVQGAKMEAIAKSAGVAVGTVYNYFADREELISALLHLRRSELLARLEAAGEAHAQSDFRTQLETFVASAFEDLETHRALFRLLLHEETSVATKPASKQTMLRELTRLADRLIAFGVEEGVLRKDDASLFGPMLVGVMRSVLIHSVTDAGAGPLRDAVLPVLRFFLEGAGAKR
jgi:AcrR family transcriptional regulator